MGVVVLVTLVRFGTDWPAPEETMVGMVVATVVIQIVFYFGGLYEKQVRLGHRMWFSRVAGLTLVGLVLGLLVVLPTGRYAVPRANLAAVGVGVSLVATGTRLLSRRLRSRRRRPRTASPSRPTPEPCPCPLSAPRGPRGTRRGLARSTAPSPRR